MPICYCILYTALIGVSSLSFVYGESQLQDLHNQVFADQKQTTLSGPNEIRKLLWELDKLLWKQNNADTIRERRKVRALIAVSNIRNSNCNLDYLQELGAYVRGSARKYNANLLAYLSYYQNEQFNLCKQHYDIKLAFRLGLLSGNDMVNVDYLREAIEQASNNLQSIRNPALEIPVELVADGLFSYMTHEQHDKLEFEDQPDAEYQLATKFQQSIEALCKRFNSCMSQTIIFYKLYASQGTSLQGKDQLGTSELDLLTNERVCAIILNNKQSLLYKLYDRFKRV